VARPGLALTSFDPYHSSAAPTLMLALLRRVSPFRVSSVRAFSTTRSNAAPSNSIQELADLVEETQSRLEEAEQQVQEFSSSNLRTWSEGMLKFHKPYQPVTPRTFTMQDRTKKKSILKRPYLGPSAKVSRRKDVFHQLGIDPLQESLNPTLLSYFVTDMGRVMSRAETQLTWRSQRRLSKAIRRAKMMGIIPLHSKKPRL